MDLSGFTRLTSLEVASYVVSAPESDRTWVVAEGLNYARSVSSRLCETDIASVASAINGTRFGPEQLTELRRFGVSKDDESVHLKASKWISRALVLYTLLEDYLGSTDIQLERGTLRRVRGLSSRHLEYDSFCTDPVGREALGDVDGIDFEDLPTSVETARQVRKMLAKQETINSSSTVNNPSEYLSGLRKVAQETMLDNPSGWAKFFNAVVTLSGLNGGGRYRLPEPSRAVGNYLSRITK